VGVTLEETWERAAAAVKTAAAMRRKWALMFSPL